MKEQEMTGNSRMANTAQKFKVRTQNSRNTAFGLKEISRRVMEIIKENGQTTYKMISDQIVGEINEKSLKDEKNIRRRIYDSLNVMKSMKLFHKDKRHKTIVWNWAQENDPLNEIEDDLQVDEFEQSSAARNDPNHINRIAQLKREIQQKRDKSKLLVDELTGLKSILQRNQQQLPVNQQENKVYFPFIVIEFPKESTDNVNIALNENKTKAHFGFDIGEAMYGDLDAVAKIGKLLKEQNQD